MQWPSFKIFTNSDPSLRLKERMKQIKKGFVLFLLLLFSFGACFASEKEDSIRIGILDTIDPWFFVWSFGDSMERLRERFVDKRITSQELSFSQLLEAIKKKELDFFIAPSGFFAFVADSSGARHLATFHKNSAKDPGKSVGSVFVKRAGDIRFNSLKDLSKATFSATDPNSFEGWIIAKGELFKQGVNVEDIEKRALFTGYGLPDVLTFVLNKSVDVGILKACELEKLIADGTIPKNAVEVIGEKKNDGLACKVSTDLYPDVVFASLPKASSKLVKEISIALFLMPEVGEGNWGFASDFSAVQDLYRSLRMGPFEYLNHTTPKALLYEYRYIFYSIAIIGFIGLLYIVAVKRLVAKRTKDLRLALKKKEELQKEARSIQDRLFQMEKAGVVQELSALFAHEAQQPIASLINYSDGLKQYLASQNRDEIIEEALSEISAQAQRLSDIINKVRSYAKHKNRVFKIFALNDSIHNALKHVKKTRGSFDIPINLCMREQAHVLGDPLEIELVIVNLIKNSLTALSEMKNGSIEVSLSEESPFWKLTVKDNGKELPEETYRLLAQPIHSNQGLGLGLSICKVIAENHGGKISFEQIKPQGLAASLYLPIANPTKEKNVR